MPNNSSNANQEKSCNNKSFSFKDELKRFYRMIKEKIIYKIGTALGALEMAVVAGLFYSEKLENDANQYSESSHKNFLEQKNSDVEPKIMHIRDSLKYKIPSDFDFRKSENDFILLQFCESDLYPKGDAEFNKAGIKYSDEEKASFAPKFEELRNNLTEILKKKKEYGIY